MAPLRVVSLLPSATEIIQLVSAHCESGAQFQLVGRSHECDFPPGLEHLPMLTAAKTQVQLCQGLPCDSCVCGLLDSWFNAKFAT